MNNKSIIILMFSIVFIFTGCVEKNSNNTLEINQNDEKQILEYLDTKTNDISSPSTGKLYSSYKILGIEQNKIYIWLVKEEYITSNDYTKSVGNVVACPVVLYVKKDNKRFSIKSHDSPEDGTSYGKTLQKLFPKNIRDIIVELTPDDTSNLRKIIKIRSKKN